MTGHQRLSATVMPTRSTLRLSPAEHTSISPTAFAPTRRAASAMAGYSTAQRGLVGPRPPARGDGHDRPTTVTAACRSPRQRQGLRRAVDRPRQAPGRVRRGRGRAARRDHLGGRRWRRLDGVQRLLGPTRATATRSWPARCFGGVDLTEASVHLREGPSHCAASCTALASRRFCSRHWNDNPRPDPARAPRRSSTDSPATATPSTNSERSNLTGH